MIVHLVLEGWRPKGTARRRPVKGVGLHIAASASLHFSWAVYPCLGVGAVDVVALGDS